LDLPSGLDGVRSGNLHHNEKFRKASRPQPLPVDEGKGGPVMWAGSGVPQQTTD
jgi:hypothetical protein